MKGAVAAGHHLTAESAAEILRAGGNAFDAAIGGFFVACVTEPVLASPGGGGFLLSRNRAGQNRVFDFFTHTPGATPRANGIDFHPVTVDFGAVRQEFHIGLGACAVPGTVRGMFAVHRDLATLPMDELMRPAVELARNGVAVNRFQSYLLDLVSPIYRTESALPLFASPNPKASRPDELMQPGLCRYLTRADLESYRVCRRAPLEIPYRNHRLIINPAPSAGGLLIGFGLELLKLLKQADFAGDGFGGESHLGALIETLRATSEARGVHFCDGPSEALLNPKLLAQYRRRVAGRTRASRGTTHISAIDAEGNIASLTVSNGEGCGRLMADTGFMLNNMLGEEDANPGGFHHWHPNQRMSP